MRNIVIVTSVIDTPNRPFSYCATRSVYTRSERFEQTKRTISSIRQYMNDALIFLVDCTDFTFEERDYFDSTCDYILNLWDHKGLHNDIFGVSKALGEATLLNAAFTYIMDNNIEYDNLYKLSGRYYLNNSFNYGMYQNDKLVFKKIYGDDNNIVTIFYQIPKRYVSVLRQFLSDNRQSMIDCIGIELLFGKFLKLFDDNEKIFYDHLGVEGMIAVTVNEFVTV